MCNTYTLCLGPIVHYTDAFNIEREVLKNTEDKEVYKMDEAPYRWERYDISF